jgi:hypothetical protein
MNQATSTRKLNFVFYPFESRWLLAPLPISRSDQIYTMLYMTRLLLHEKWSLYLDPFESRCLLAPFAVRRSDSMFVMFCMRSATPALKLNVESRSVRRWVITRIVSYFSVRSEFCHVLPEPEYFSTEIEICISIRSIVGVYSHHFQFLGPMRGSWCFALDPLHLHREWTSNLDPFENRWLLAPFPISRSDPMYAMFYIKQGTSPPKLNCVSRIVRESVITRAISDFSVRSHVRYDLFETRYPFTKIELCISIRSKIGNYSYHFRFHGSIRCSSYFTGALRSRHQKWSLHFDRFKSRLLLGPFKVSRSHGVWDKVDFKLTQMLRKSSILLLQIEWCRWRRFRTRRTSSIMTASKNHVENVKSSANSYLRIQVAILKNGRRRNFLQPATLK